MSILFDGVYENPTTPWWSTGVANPANIEASTITINAAPAGNILLTSVLSSTTDLNAPLIFQRPALDPNAPSESLVMNLSDDVPTKASNGSYITATKASGTAYDDIAVAGLQVYGDQTTSANSGAHAYITGEGGNLILAPKNSVYVSSLQVSSLQVVNVISTTAGVANSYTANLWMSTPILNTVAISSSQISTNTITAVTANISTINVSTLNAPNFAVSTVSTVSIDAKVTLTSTLSLTGSPTNINLGLGDVIQGLVGGAATQALGVGIGGAGLITGAAALATGRTSGGVNSNIFQTVNGSTQLQFSTIGSAVSSIFLTVNSPNPLTTPGLEIQQSQGVAAGTYCVRSVGDPLYINNNVSSIQMYGQWVPVIQPTATIPGLAISSLGVSSINGATYPPPGGGGIPSTLAASTITINGNQTQSGTGTFNWGGNTMSPTQVVLARPTSVNATLTTTGGAFLNAGATTNSLTISALGSLTAPGGGTFSWGSLPDFRIQGGVVTVNALAQFNQGAIMSQNLSASGGLTVTGGTVQFNPSVTMLGNLSVVGNGRFSAVSTNTISTNTLQSATGTISSFFVSSINNAAYPPGSGGGIPSTLNASTINFDGGLNNVGDAPINTNTINTTNANVNFYVGNAINAASISTTTISTNTVFAGAITTNTMNTTTTNANNVQSAAMSTNTLSTNTMRAAAISSFMISSANGIITNLNVSSVNGAAYPPGGGGGGGIPSTINASTINVNGGINIANGGIINTSFEPIRTGYLSTNFLSTGLITADTLRADFLSTNTIRAAGLSTNFISSQTLRADSVSTNFISSQTITASNVGSFQFSSLSGSINAFTSFSISTINLSTQVLMAGSISTNTISTNFLTAASISTNLISTNALVASSGNVTSMAVSSLNGFQIPQSLGVPIGSITIWAGGSDTGGTQTFSIPSGWLVCDGSGQDKLVYNNLFNVIGQKYAMNKPLSGLNFYLPDLTFAVPMGTPYRNYSGVLTTPNQFEINFQTWPSDFSPYINAPTQTWKITQTTGGTLNYGTFFPANAISQPGYPSVYVKQILSYDGNQGYVVVQSVNNSNIPQTLGVIIGRGDGTVPQDISGTYLYTLGSYGTQSAYPQVTHNQAEPEVGVHTHPTGTIVSNEAVDGFATTRNRSFVQYEMPNAPNQFSTISTIGYTNVGTYTAPNFINMLYIIKY